MSDVQTAKGKLQTARRVAVLTGAGISKPSGIPTFRDAAGLWKDFDIEEYATPRAYARNPQKVWEWYGWRYQNVLQAQPNQAHVLLARLEAQTPNFLLVTQNVDGLHERAGSKHLVELHGNITQARCEGCGQIFTLPLPEQLSLPPQCPHCCSRGRPNVVWFGELLPDGALEQSLEAFSRCEVALIIGTSGEVEPAASLGRVATRSGAFVIEINPEATPLSPIADLSLRLGAVEGMEFLM